VVDVVRLMERVVAGPIIREIVVVVCDIRMFGRASPLAGLSAPFGSQ
jgi:hypothetical protein